MSTHSYSRLWTHLIGERLNREPMLDKTGRRQSFIISAMGWNGGQRETIKMVTRSSWCR